MNPLAGFSKSAAWSYFASHGIPMALGGAAGAVSALFLKNEDRGYFRTALVTVPLASAAAVAGTELFRGMAPVFRDMNRAASAAASAGGGFPGFIKDPLPALRAMAESGAFAQSGDVLSPLFLQAQHSFSLAAYADAFDAAETAGDVDALLEKARKALSGMLEKAAAAEEYESKAIRQGLYFTLQSGLQKASDYAEFMKNPELAGFSLKPENLEPEALRNLLEQIGEAARANPEYSGVLRSMPGRFSYLDRNSRFLEVVSVEPGSKDFAKLLKIAAVSNEEVFYHSPMDLIDEVTKSQPRLEAAIRKALSSKYYDRVSVIRGPKQEIVGFRFYSGRQSLSIGVVSPETGRVNFGKGFLLSGVARKVGDPDSVSFLDEYLLSNIDADWDLLRDLQSRAIVFSNVNVDDEYFEKARRLPDSAIGLVDEPAAEFRKAQVVPTTLPVFNGKRFDELDQREKIEYLKNNINRFRKYGSESSFRNLVMELPEIEKIRVGQMFSMSQQEPVFRAYSKSFRLKPDTVPATMRGGVFSSRLKSIFSGQVPAASVTVAGVNPRQVAFFASLPVSAEKLGDPEISKMLVRHLTEDVLSDLPDLPFEEAERRAEAAYKTFVSRIRNNPQMLQKAKALGTLGETEFVLDAPVRLMNAAENSVYRLAAVSDPVLEALEIGSAQPRYKMKLHNLFLGYSKSGKPVFASSDNAYVTKIVPLEDGELALYLREEHSFKSGFKVDILGRKGLATVNPSAGDIEDQAEILNLLYSETGRGKPYSGPVTAFANAEYFTSKIKEESFLGLLENARLLAEQDPSLRQSLRELLEPEMFTLNPVGSALQLIEDSDKVAALNDSQKADRISRIARNLESWINSSAANLPEVRQAVESGLVQTPAEYFHRYRQAATMAVWDTSTRNMPEATSVTFDVLGLLHQQGEYEIVRDLLSNSSPVSGDARMAWDYLSRLARGDFQPAEGEAVFRLQDIPVRSSFSEPGELAGTLFDPGNPKTAGNFWIDLGREVEFDLGGKQIKARHIPVPGNAAFRSGVNEYGPGLAATGELQRELMHAAKELMDADYFGSATDLGLPVQRYLEKVVQSFAGKKGILRSRIESHMAVQGAIQSRPAKGRVRIGGEVIHDPFEFVISSSYLEEPGMIPPDIRRKLLSGEEVYGVLFRHPVSATPIGRVRVAGESDFLAPNAIGIDESLRSMLQADSDKDLAYLMFLQSEDAIQRARKATLADLPVDASGIRTISDWRDAGFQWRQVRAVQLLQGSTEDPARMTASYIRQNLADKTLISEVLSGMQKLAGEGPVSPERLASLTRRTAGDTIGFYSNLLSGLYLNLENHPDLILNPAERATLVPILWNIRQVPISAQKGKMSFGEGNAMGLAYQMLAGMRAADTETGFDLVHDAMVKISEGSGFETLVGSAQDVADIKELFGLEDFFDAASGARRPIEPGSRFNLFSEYLRSDPGKSLIRKFVSGRNRSVDDLAALLTSSEIDPGRALNIVRKMQSQGLYGAEYLRGYLVGERPAANMAAQMIGALNQSLSRSADAASPRIAKALPILVAGAAVAAGAGLLMTPIRKQRRAEEAAGETDSVPGEPVEGSESANPPVDVRPPRSGVKRAVLSSVQKSVVASVDARAKDSSEEAEIEKAARRAASAGGEASVQITRLGGHRERMSKLRMRQELKDRLDREAVY